MARAKTINYALARLMRETLAAERMTISELGRRSNLGRQVAGRIVRGEIRRIAPDQVNAIAHVLPLTTAQIMEASNYRLGTTPQRRLQPELVDLLLELHPEDLATIRRTARALAAYRRQEPVNMTTSTPSAPATFASTSARRPRTTTTNVSIGILNPSRPRASPSRCDGPVTLRIRRGIANSPTAISTITTGGDA